ncbi:MAG: domain S-box protein [Bacteroidota bacterium]|nr:domain S-box protein [Bacteroidota bacterium]
MAKSKDAYRILVADDNVAAAESLVEVYELEGYEVLIARDGLEALEILKVEKVDLLISDILMPNLDGYNLCYRIRNNAQLKDLPVIIYTGTYTSLSEEEAAREMGASMFFRKPADIKVLISAAKDILSKPRNYPHRIPSEREGNEMMHQYSAKLVDKLEQSNLQLEATRTKLGHSEAGLKRAQAVAHVGSWEIDFSADVSMWSDELCLMMGLSPNENKQGVKAFLGFVHPLDIDFVSKRIEESNRSLSDCAFDYRIITKTGIVKHVHLERKFDFDATGKVVSKHGILHDITGRKLIEENLRKSEASLKDAQALAHIGSWEIDMTTNILRWSDEQFHLLGLKRGEVVESNELFLSMVHPDDSAEVNEGFYHTFESFENSSKNFRIIRRDGIVRHVYCEWKFEFDDKKRPLRIHGIVQDVTEKKEAETKLADSEKRFRAFFESASEGLIVLDINSSSFIMSNPRAEKYVKFSEEQLTKMKLGALSPEFQPDGQRSSEKVQGFIASALNGNIPVFEWVIRNANGEDVLFEMRFAALHEATPQILVSFVDITDRKEIEKKIIDLNEHLEERVQERTADLTEANMALEAFSSTVSHDLRSPVRAVNSFAKIIQQDYGDKLDPEVLELFGHIVDSGRRMTAIIDDLLKLARYGKEKLKFEPVNMNVLVNGIWLNISRTLPHSATLELTELPELIVDMSMMQQVVVNLLSNAIKYSSKKEHPVVNVWCEETEKNVTIYFKDNGAGFDMRHHDRLFGAFQRLHNARDFEGTGVGLTLVKRIIEKHGGTIEAKGEVGEGATFWFTLPKIATAQN